MTRRPRLLAALWFAGAALLAVGPIFGVLAWRQGRPVPMVLFVGLPVLASGLAGALLGQRILRLEAGYVYAALNGLATSVLALILYGLMLGPVEGLVSEAVGTGGFVSGTLESYLGMLYLVVIGGLLAMGPILYPVGMLAGLGLNWFGSLNGDERSTDDPVR